MSDLLCYKTMPVWTAQTLPAAFQRRHNTKEGTWAQLAIHRGDLLFQVLNEQDEVLEEYACSAVHPPPRIAPQQWHRIASVSDDIACQLSFLCSAEDYFAKKHRLTRTHSAVIEALRHVAPGRALDLGCGNGRNALYLALKGFEVTAWDRDEASLGNLARIAGEENLSSLTTARVDLNDAVIDAQYDFILSTVVMMFLQPQAVPALIRRMQQATAPGGYNLIVAAIDSPDMPSPIPFPFLFKPGELRDAYADWTLLEYNENPGELHKLDAQGNRIRLRFATLLARRPA